MNVHTNHLREFYFNQWRILSFFLGGGGDPKFIRNSYKQYRANNHWCPRAIIFRALKYLLNCTAVLNIHLFFLYFF